MKNKLIKSTIILVIGGFFTKVLGMIIKIIMTRKMGPEGIGIYMLLLPTFSLFIALAQLGFPIAISKLVADNNHNNKKLVFSIIPVSMFLNIIILVFLFFSSHFIAEELLREPRSYYGLICMGFVLPFISISSILRGYFFGKEKMLPHVISNITEDVIRLIILFIGIPIFLRYGIEFAVAFVVLSNIISECTSIFVLFFFLPKHFSISKQDFTPESTAIKEVFSISIPSTAGRLIGSIGYFLEPIILTSTLLQIGYNNQFIVTEYGIISGYVMPLLLLPSFFTGAISQALLPIVSKSYGSGQKKYAKTKIKQAIFFSLLIGIPVTIIFLIWPEIPLRIIYNTNEGLEYIIFMAPICLLHYIQAPLTSSLQAMGKAKEAMLGTLGGTIIRTILLYLCCLLKIGMWGLIIATSSNIIYVTFHQYKHVKKYLQ